MKIEKYLTTIILKDYLPVYAHSMSGHSATQREGVGQPCSAEARPAHRDMSNMYISGLPSYSPAPQMLPALRIV